MKDPVQNIDRALFDQVAQLMHQRPREVVLDVGMNLLLNAIRQSTAKRVDAEAMLNELFGRAKTVLLDLHYDPIHGFRRGVIPHTQVVQMPFHDEGNVIFHGK